MSENKRVSLTTLSCGSSAKKPNKSVRVRVALPESNEDTYPEFNYKDELVALKKKPKQDGKEIGNSLPNGTADDPFGGDDNDDDVRRIALEMEAKYGSGVSGGPKKKRRGRKDDYADIGAGYDESDSFIDNTDGYDEMIPPNVTTVRGGFYINSGALEFKTDDEATSELSSDSSEDEKEESTSEQESKAPKRKRILDSSEDEGDAVEKNQGAKDAESGEKQPNISLQQAIKKKMFSSDKIQVKKRKLSDFYHEKTVVKDLLKEKRTQPNNSDGRDIPKENKKPMRLSSVMAAIDSVIGRAEDNVKHKFSENLENVSDDLPRNQMEVKVVEVPIEVPVAMDNSKPNECIKLPENLPEDILEIIENIKRVARDQKEGGLVKFFSDPVNELFLNLERKCKILGRSSKVKVYEHLASFVKCRKETLMKRSKTLVYEGEKAKLNKTIDSLKGQINQLMPALITNHEKECQRILQKKFSQEAVVNEELKHLKAPRRKFPLHEDMKRMIREIVVFKKRCFLHDGKRKEDLEELLLGYMKSDILTLWPDGWMSMTVLKKYCAPAGLKTPDVTALATKPLMVPYNSGSSLTITPVNLSEKQEEVNGSGGGGGATIDRSPPTTITHTIWKNDCPPLERKESTKDNGVIVLSSVKKDNENSLSVQSPSSSHHHCQIIDLTEVGPSTSDLRLSNNAAQDDVQKVIESLKALHKLSSSPSKSEPSSQSGVSVIAYSKNYGTNSNENSFQDGFNGSSSASASSKPRL